MHPTAMNNCQQFFDSYAGAFAGLAAKGDVRVVEIGSQDVNGSLRSTCPAAFHYTGVDFCEAAGVDVVLQDPYALPFDDASVDIVLSSSCFEHSEFFWLVYLEVMRCLKPGGLFYLNVPSSGDFHRYPVDCWRFYPDSGQALTRWGQRNGISSMLLESYTQLGGSWQDYVAVFLKDAGRAAHFPDRILDRKTDFENGHVNGRSELLNHAPRSQNEKKLHAVAGIVSGSILLR